MGWAVRVDKVGKEVRLFPKVELLVWPSPSERKEAADLEANLMSERIRDYLIVVGHLWIGDECRDAFFKNPSSVLIGFKLSQDEKERLHKLTEASFSSMELLVEATGLHYDELREAIDHPRSRMRHLISRKRETPYR